VKHLEAIVDHSLTILAPFSSNHQKITFLAYFRVIYYSIFIIYRILLQAALIKLVMLFLVVLSNTNNYMLVGVNYMLENH
jgi:hypothetical protein